MNEFFKTYFFDIIFKNYFNCEGKANRKEFWLFILNSIVFILLMFFLSYFAMRLLIPIFPYYEFLFFVPIVIFLTFIVLPLLLLCPLINLFIRRLHDIGWNTGVIFVIILMLPLGLILSIFIGLIPGKEEANQNIEINKKEKVIINAIIIFIVLLICYIFSYFPLKSIENLNKIAVNRTLIINKIVESELKYFEQNNNFLYIDKTDSNDILDVSIKGSEFFDEFSCVPVTDQNKSFVVDKNKDCKRVEIQVWTKHNIKDKNPKSKSYVCVVLNDDGTQTKSLYRSMN